MNRAILKKRNNHFDSHHFNGLEIQNGPLKFLLLVVFTALLTVATRKANAEDEFSPSYQSRWGITVDNDLLTPDNEDTGYTGGFNVTYFNRHLAAGKSKHNPLNILDNALSLDDRFESTFTMYSMEFGGFGFTPSDINTAEPDFNDRPYASLVYLTSTKERVSIDQHYNLSSTFTVGLLGLDLIEGTQSAIHDATDSTPILGWRNQISEGGELTGQYSISREENIVTDWSNLQIKKAAGVSLGYITELNYSVGLRYGNIKTSWWSFKPERSLYSVGSNHAISAPVRGEYFFWFGFAARLRAYNALLQGQFRSSAVTYTAEQVRPLLVEAWAGFTTSISDEVQIAYQIRGHTSELQQGNADRDVIWGGIAINLQY